MMLSFCASIKKRSNRIVFFDDECARILKRWIAQREELNVMTKGLSGARTQSTSMTTSTRKS